MKITYQQILMNNIYILDILLEYLKHCHILETDRISEEIARIRSVIRPIEEMTRTERQREFFIPTMKIDSIINEE